MQVKKKEIQGCGCCLLSTLLLRRKEEGGGEKEQVLTLLMNSHFSIATELKECHGRASLDHLSLLLNFLPVW